MPGWFEGLSVGPVGPQQLVQSEQQEQRGQAEGRAVEQLLVCRDTYHWSVTGAAGEHSIRESQDEEGEEGAGEYHHRIARVGLIADGRFVIQREQNV